MDAIKQIIRQAGYDSVTDLPINDPITVENEGYMDLTIERILDDRVSVAHYFEQCGDLCRDPEIVFRLAESGWIPVMYQQDNGPLGTVFERDDHGLPDVEDFVEQWNDNLTKQGFVEQPPQVA